MALNPDYVPMTPMWELHSDKDTGEFLRSGYAKFSRDTARTVGKPVYKLTGSPPNYSYIAEGYYDTDGLWRVDLNDQGAFDDILYGYVLDEDGNTELYYVQFFSMDDVPQFTREGQPNFIEEGEGPTQEVDINYIPNGQFRLHLDLPETSNYDAGEVRSPITQCAFGGWTFERPTGSTARDFVTFKRFASYTANPDKSPRYEIEIECESPSAGDAYKDLRIKFDDVNKFASTTDELTFAISGKYASGGAINVDLVLIKNYGTGGDAATETTLTTFALTSTYQIFYHAFTFGDNIGKSIGPNNDDYVQLALRFPVDNIYDVVFTDAILTPGDISSPVFDDTTTRQFIYRSIFDEYCPAADGSDLYLPMTLTNKGLIPDHSVVGRIYTKASATVSTGELNADGSAYEYEGYSTEGIPYSRLGSVLTAALSTGYPLSFSMPLFGTGTAFLTADILDNKDIKISTNTKGSVSNPTDGSPATGFTFRNNHTGQTDIGAKGYVSQSNTFLIISDDIGQIRPGFSNGGGSTTNGVVNINGDDAKSVITVTVGASTPASSYIQFDTPSTVYVLWYKVDGVGSAPAVPGATFIEVDLYTTFTQKDCARITADSISGKQVSQITCVAASAITAGSYFVLDTLTQSYYVWYEKDGAGTDPAPSGKIGIKVAIAGTDTKDEVTSKTVTAINIKYYAVPDLRGLFLRGTDDGASIDLDAASRYANNSVIVGDSIGTLQYSNNISHPHSYYISGGETPNREYFDSIALGTGTWEAAGVEPNDPRSTPIGVQGGPESRPQNIYVNYVIKY